MLKSSYKPDEIRQLLAQEESRKKRFYYVRLERYCNKISRVMAKKKWKEVTVFFKGRTSTTLHSIRLDAHASCIYDLKFQLEAKGFHVEERHSMNCLEVSV